MANDCTYKPLNEVAIREVVEFAIGGGWGNKNWVPDSVPVRVIRGTDFEGIRNGDYARVPRRYEKSNKVERRELRPGDVLLEISGGSPSSNRSTGRSFYVSPYILEYLGDKSIPASFCRLVRFNESKVDSRYAYYSLQEMHLSGRARLYELQSTGISNFQFEYFLDSETITLPPLAEQRRIAHMLGTLDDKIELNRRMNETLDEMARAIFKDWFVDFGPVRAKMEGRDPYLPDDIWKLFPDSLADSELGQIPDSWEVKRLGDCFDLKMGQSPPSRTYNDDGEGLPFFQGKSDFGFRYPDNRKYCSAPNRIAESGDTLVSVRAPVGDINMAWERCCVGRGLAALRHETGSRSFTYYSTWTLQHELRRYEHTGTVFGAINKKQFEELLTINPKRDIVNAFESLACVLDDRIESNVAESRTLAAMRDTLLPKLISGEVRINT